MARGAAKLARERGLALVRGPMQAALGLIIIITTTIIIIIIIVFVIVIVSVSSTSLSNPNIFASTLALNNHAHAFGCAFALSCRSNRWRCLLSMWLGRTVSQHATWWGLLLLGRVWTRLPVCARYGGTALTFHTSPLTTTTQQCAVTTQQ